MSNTADTTTDGTPTDGTLPNVDAAGTLPPVFTRFPPEPNGFLHLGHVKAMIIDFEKHENGQCYLRFDDTNPETEEQRFADQIIADVTWMGYKPWKITYTSDYFPKLLELAWQLVREGKAYVDFSTQDEIKAQRGALPDGTWGPPSASPHRDRPILDNISDFQRMQDGRYAEGHCCLRLKMDYRSDNPNMRDLVAYSIKYTPHFRTKGLYCVYPSYDFAHCLVDSIERISFSYCTLEFVTRQESYFWLIDQLGMYRPTVYEFSRLNVAGSILSKRKIKKLIADKCVEGYDDPRLLTIMGLKKRGYTPTALLNAVRQLGHTRVTSTLSIQLLENSIREELNKSAPRIFGIVDPLEVCIVNFGELTPEQTRFERPIHPMDPTFGTRAIQLTEVVYIDREDFMEEASKQYYRLTKAQKVRFKYTTGIVEYISHELASDGVTIKRINATYTPDTTTKVKGILGWISNSPSEFACATFNVYGQLLGADNEFNRESLQIKTGLVETPFGFGKDVRFQIERMGYFIVSKLKTQGSNFLESAMLNQIVSLRESNDKKTLHL